METDEQSSRPISTPMSRRGEDVDGNTEVPMQGRNIVERDTVRGTGGHTLDFETHRSNTIGIGTPNTCDHFGCSTRIPSREDYCKFHEGLDLLGIREPDPTPKPKPGLTEPDPKRKRMRRIEKKLDALLEHLGEDPDDVCK